MAMIHARLPYWQIVCSEESMYGAIAKLHAVCWFDVSNIRYIYIYIYDRKKRLFWNGFFFV